MTIELKLTHAAGTLYPNPKFGEFSEPPYIGFVIFPSDENQTRGPLRLAVSAWHRPGGEPFSYILQLGGGLDGSMSPVSEDQRDSGHPDLDGAAGINWELYIHAWFYFPEPGAKPHIHITLSTRSTA